MASAGHNVVHLISSLSRGGRERQLASLYKYTKETTSSIKIICFNQSQDSYIEEYNMAEDVIYLHSTNIFGRYREIRKILKIEKASIIWTWGGLEAMLGLLIGLFSRIRHINGSVRHGIIKFRASHIRRMIILHLSKYRVANSHAGLKVNFLRHGYVWYNGIDDVFFTKLLSVSKREELKESLGLTEDRVILISVANLVPYKDYFTVISALKSLKERRISFYYLIVGEGPQRAAIESMISASGLTDQIRVLGRRKDIRDLLQISDLFIHSSVGEGCSNAILEAVASGLPVIASDVGGTTEILEQSNSMLFRYQDTLGLEIHLISLLSDKVQLAVMGRESLRIATERFSSTQMVRRYKDILDNVTRGKRK